MLMRRVKSERAESVPSSSLVEPAHASAPGTEALGATHRASIQSVDKKKKKKSGQTQYAEYASGRARVKVKVTVGLGLGLG